MTLFRIEQTLFVDSDLSADGVTAEIAQDYGAELENCAVMVVEMGSIREATSLEVMENGLGGE